MNKSTIERLQRLEARRDYWLRCAVSPTAAPGWFSACIREATQCETDARTLRIASRLADSRAKTQP